MKTAADAERCGVRLASRLRRLDLKRKVELLLCRTLLQGGLNAVGLHKSASVCLFHF